MTYLFKLVVTDDDENPGSRVVATFAFDWFIEAILFDVHDRSAIR
jgi:hypothetical protein